MRVESNATRKGRLRVLLSFLLPAVAQCSSDGPSGPTCCDPPPVDLRVSDPVPGSNLVGQGGASGQHAGDVVYVSLGPGGEPGGTQAVIRRLGTTSTITTAVTDGGFDPVPVAAAVGDSIEVIVLDGAGGVLLKATEEVKPDQPPVVVRTDPPKDKTDIAVNASIIIVISEPVDPASLTPTAIQLFEGITPVSGTASILQGGTTQVVFTPTTSLAPNTTYQLVVTQAVTDLEGDPLSAEVSTSFTTGTQAVGPARSVTVTPDTAALLPGAQAQLSVVARDTFGTLVVGRPITWSTDDPATATVSSSGTVTAMAEGVAHIQAEVDGWPGAATIIVSASLAPVASVTVTPATGLAVPGGFVLFTATPRDAAGNALPFRPIAWQSTSPGVADIRPGSATGTTVVILGIAAGTATITALSEGKAGSAGITVGPLGSFASVSAGFNQTCGVTIISPPSSPTGPGLPWCWGANNGALGNGTTDAGLPSPTATVPVAVVREGLRFAQVSTRFETSCGITTSGAAYCWGENLQSGALGNGTATGLSLVPVPVSGGIAFSTIAVGFGSVCGLSQSGTAYCWGRNDLGQLGVGSTSGPEDCVGDGFHPCSTVPVAVAGGHVFSTINVGEHHACGLTTGGAVHCWGANWDGQLGDGTTIARSAPVPVAAGLSFFTLGTGDGHSCAIAAGGTAYCWGANYAGQLGTGSTSGPELCTADGTPDACSSVPVAVTGSQTWATISGGGAHTCAATSTGSGYCWGEGGSGRLGNGNGSVGAFPAPVAVLGGLQFASLGVGWEHSCGVTSSGVLYCWGSNGAGRLGVGTTSGPEDCNGTSCSTVPIKVEGQP